MEDSGTGGVLNDGVASAATANGATATGVGAVEGLAASLVST